MKRKKVLFLITKSNWGGAQRYVYDLATNLDQKRYRPVVALGGTGELSEKLRAAHIKTITLAHMNNTLSPTKLFRTIRELRTIIEQEQPDIVHCNSSIAGLAGVIATRLTITPACIFTAHGWAFNEDRPTWQRVLFSVSHWLTVLLSHQTIAVSHTLKQQLRGPAVQRKMRVIHNGRTPIAWQSRQTARETLSLPASALVSGTIGELHPVKQHETMIHAVKKLQEKNYSLTHVIIGAGTAEAALRKLASELGIETQIIFTGAIHEAARLLPAFDMYVQPSKSEALAYAVIEAAQAGLPIIASRVGGIPEILEHEKSGLLLSPGNQSGFVNALERLMGDETLRRTLGSAAKESGMRFTLASMLEHTTALYDLNSNSSANVDSRAMDW